MQSQIFPDGSRGKYPFGGLATDSGASFIGWIRAAVGAVATTVANRLGWLAPNLFEFMTVAEIIDVTTGAMTIDVTSKIQAAIDSMEARGGGRLDANAGIYLCLSTVNMKRGVWLQGEGCKKPGGLAGAAQALDGVTVFYGKHTGPAIISFKGAHCCKMADVLLQGDQTDVPKTGLLCGRNSASSAGLHEFDRIQVAGYFSAVPIYLIASESNTWHDIFVTLYGGGAFYCLYTSQGDDFSVDSLTGSSNLENSFFALEFINMVNDVSAAGIFINSGGSTGTWNFVAAYCIQYAGSYYAIQAGSSDGLDGLGPFTFTGCSGEIYNQAGGGAPQQGFNLLGNTAIRGLTIHGSRMQFVNATGNERIIKQASTVTLKEADIQMQVMDNATAELQQDKRIDGYISAGVQSFTAVTYANAWADTFAIANGLELAGFYKDPTGWVHLKGCPSNGTVGLSMFTLPVGYRPANALLFAVVSNGAIGRLDVLASGVVTLSAGSNVYASLEGISFKAA